MATMTNSVRAMRWVTSKGPRRLLSKRWRHWSPLSPAGLGCNGAPTHRSAAFASPPASFRRAAMCPYPSLSRSATTDAARACTRTRFSVDEFRRLAPQGFEQPFSRQTASWGHFAMAMACASPRPVLFARPQTASSHTQFFLRLKSEWASVGFSVKKEERRGAVKTAVRSTGRDSPVASAARATMAASAETASTSQPEPRPFGVLFVCLGNICRSPSAEAVFRDVVEKRNLQSLFNIDSAGTINYHEGNPADSRMKAAALKRGVKLTSISRPIRPSDFEEFDLILAMDKSNLANILVACESWNKRSALPPNAKEKVKLMCSYCTKHTNYDEVPDPYYGGPAGFEKVLDLLEDACEGLLASIQELQVRDGKVDVKTSM